MAVCSPLHPLSLPTAASLALPGSGVGSSRDSAALSISLYYLGSGKTNPHHTTDVLKRLGQVALLSKTVSCPRSFGIPTSSLSPHRGSKEEACVMAVLRKELNTGIFILFFKLLDCPRTPLPFRYLGERGRKLRDRFPASNYFT